MAICRLEFLLPFCFVSAFFIRIIIFKSSLSESLSNRIEIATPISSWKRVVEGISLVEKGIDPYEGDTFHESPLSLKFYKYIYSFKDQNIPILFAVCDIITASFLTLASALYLKNLAWKENVYEKCDKSATALLFQFDRVEDLSFYTSLVYLFCPYTIAACCGKSTIVFLNVLVSGFVMCAVGGQWFIAAIILGFVSYHSLYHVSLLVPLIMFILDDCYKKNRFTIFDSFRILYVFFTFVVTLSSLLYESFQKTGSWQFLMSTYGFALSVPDLTPNVGLFWYFFTEMFEHFRIFFLWTFQLNAFIYTIPLAIRLRREPMLLLFIHLMIVALFKSYPSLGDIAMYMALLPLWSHLFIFMRQSFLIGCGLVACTLLAPILWHLWIYSGSANANFYFAITLAFNTSQIFLLTDVLSAHIKREYYLLRGIPIDKDGKLSILRLR